MHWLKYSRTKQKKSKIPKNEHQIPLCVRKGYNLEITLSVLDALSKYECSQGGQKKRYKDTLKASLKDFNIPTESWEQAAQDRTKWRCLINKGASYFEAKRIYEAERKR